MVERTGGLLGPLRRLRSTRNEPSEKAASFSDTEGSETSPEQQKVLEALDAIMQETRSGKPGSEIIANIKKIAETRAGVGVDTGRLEELISEAERGERRWSEADVLAALNYAAAVKSGTPPPPASKKIEKAGRMVADMMASIDGIRVTPPVRGYSKKWIASPAGEYGITTLDMGITSAGVGLLLSSVFGVHIEELTWQHAALY